MVTRSTPGPRPSATGEGGTAVAAAIGQNMAGPADGAAGRDVAVKLNYFIRQITPEEFRWQDANYDQDSALGRELLFLIANNDWSRATSEIIDIARSDTVETTVKIDVDLNRIAHEAFRGRTGQLWLPVLVLPPLRPTESLRPTQEPVPEHDPFATLTVTDASGAFLATLPNADVQHRAAAALAEIIVNIAIARLPDLGQLGVSASRDERLLLSAAIYRLLRNEHVPGAVMAGGIAAQPAPGGPAQRIGTARRALTDLLWSYAGLLGGPGLAGAAQAAAAGQDGGTGPGQDFGPGHAAPDRRVFARVLAERAVQVLDAFTKSAVVVVVADRARTPTVLTVTVPSRPLHERQPRRASGRGRPSGMFRRLRPSTLNRVLPWARLDIDLLVPSADADRQVQVNLPDGVSFNPWQKPDRRAELDIRVGPPPPVTQLRYLMDQLAAAPAGWPAELHRALVDLTGAKAAASRETLRDHQVVPLRLRDPMATGSRVRTRDVGDRLDLLCGILSRTSAGLPIAEACDGLAMVWQGHGDWLDVPMQRRTSTDTVSPDVVVARAGMIEDVSQRGAPYQATIGVQVAVTDSEYFSVARFSGWMSVVLMSVVFAFFLIGRASGIASQQVSAEVLAIVLTLFSAVQAGRMERPDRSTLRGRLAQGSNLVVGIQVLPTMVLAVALAFSRGMLWVVGWALGCIAFQLVLQWLLRRRQRLDADQQGRTRKGLRTQTGILLRTDSPDYSHAEVLHSTWWRGTTADALLVGRPAHGYVVWQHGATLRSLLHSGRPAVDPALRERLAGWRSERWWLRRAAGQLAQSAGMPRAEPGGPAPGRPDPGPPRAGGLPPGDGQSGEDGEQPASLLEQPANVLALQRSGTMGQSVTFAVFRDQPKGDWEAATQEVHRVDLDASQLAPASDVSAVVGVFLGLPRDAGLLTLADHPVTAVLRAAASGHSRLGVLEIQLPVPPPSAVYTTLQWSRVQVGLRDGDYGRLTSFLSDVRELAVTTGVPGLVVGVQTVSEGIPRILSPPTAAASPGPAAEQAETGAAHLVLASDLDVVAGSGLHRTENASDQTWRLLAICSDWRSAEEIEVLDGLDRDLQLAGLTTAILHGKLVILLLGHRPGGRGGHDKPLLVPLGSDGQVIVYLDKWQSRQQLGEGRGQPLLRVRMRTPDRPGATREVIESLRETLQEMGLGPLTDRDWKVWYTRTVVTAGRAAVIQLTVRLAVNPATTPQHHPIKDWGPAEMSQIERRALALAASKMAASGTGSVADLGLDAPEDTVISVSLITAPDLGGPGARAAGWPFPEHQIPTQLSATTKPTFSSGSQQESQPYPHGVTSGTTTAKQPTAEDSSSAWHRLTPIRIFARRSDSHRFGHPLLRLLISLIAITAAVVLSIKFIPNARPLSLWEVIAFDGITALGTALVGITGLIQVLASRKSARGAPANKRHDQPYNDSPSSNRRAVRQTRVDHGTRSAASVGELTKLAALLEKGVIDQQEFQLLKSGLLSDIATDSRNTTESGG
jgi:hypothetical protein